MEFEEAGNSLTLTTESEYVAASHATNEALWIKSLVSQIFEPLTVPIDIYVTISLPFP